MPDPCVDGSPKGRTARIVGCALDKPGEAARPGGAVGAEATRRPVDAHPQRVGAAATGAPAAAGPRSRRHHPVRRVDAVRVPARGLVHAVGRLQRRGAARLRQVSLRPAHPDRLAGGDLPVHLRDDLPEPRGAALRDPGPARFRDQRARRGVDRDDRRQAGHRRARGAREGGRAHGRRQGPAERGRDRRRGPDRRSHARHRVRAQRRARRAAAAPVWVVGSGTPRSVCPGWIRISSGDGELRCVMPARRPAVPSVDSSLGLTLLPTVLSLIAGSADVISFLGLGGLFVAHITGNLVLLAAHLVTGTRVSVALLLSVPVFVLGLGLTRLLAAGLDAVGLASLRPLLLLQFLLLAGFLALGVAAGPWIDPNAGAALGAACFAAADLWSLALPAGLALLAFAIGLGSGLDGGADR